ncbi:hypothetical protein CHCC15087_3792 [Bacillus licheniformis]|nr:hypothetical protein CHCC15087_3792 [Bacillus licheniformis]
MRPSFGRFRFISLIFSCTLPQAGYERLAFSHRSPGAHRQIPFS